MNSVERVLAGRDGRALLQKLIIRRSRVVVQISLNIPGFPKKIDGDRALIEAVAIYFKERTRTLGCHAVCSISIDNGAGSAHLFDMPGADAVALKKIGIDIEDRKWGSVLDIDVLGVDGALHRRDLGGAERKCFACGGFAKICAREKKHDLGILRKIATDLLMAGLKEMLH
ncbi:MAG: hypothetical protein STSR0007_07010 [Thermovirga sp.]